MALKKPEPTNTPEFEVIDENGVDAGGEDAGEQTEVVSPAARMKAAADKRAAEAQAATPSASKEVATTKPGAGAVVKATVMVNPLLPLKDAFFCEFDTLRALKLSVGNVIDQQTNKPLGDVIGLELLSYQDQWVVSPGVDGDEGKELARYSDDGVTTSKGDDCAEYLANLKATGYDKAKMTKRMVIAGSLFDIGVKGRKDLPDLQDELVQISLAPTSKAAFDRYMMGQAFKIGKGFITPDGATRLRIVAEPVSRNKQDWTQAAFSRWDEKAE